MCIRDSDNGAMYTYWLDIGKDRYYLDENGVLQTGLFYLSDSTSGSKYAYQADANGVLIRMYSRVSLAAKPGTTISSILMNSMMLVMAR